MRATYSTPSVPGLLMAVGNVGEYLEAYDQSDTFLSRDGGFTWEEVHKDAHLWEFGDSGSILVMANDEGPTDHYTTRSELMKAYRSLEITSSATAEEIKCAYRRCMQRYHPDRLDRDLPPEQHKASTHKVQQIQKAYALLCQARNIQ